MSKYMALCIFSLSALASPLMASANEISAILGEVTKYDGQHVNISGTVQNLREKVSHAGNPYATFLVCSGACIKVFTFGDPPISNGQNVDVAGEFNAVKHMGRYTFYDEVDSAPEEIHTR